MTPESAVRVAQLFMNSSCIIASGVNGSMRAYCFLPGFAGAAAGALGTSSAIGPASDSGGCAFKSDIAEDRCKLLLMAAALKQAQSDGLS